MDTYVSTSKGRGRGVFAGRDYEADDVIEIAHAIVIPAAEGQRWDDNGIMAHYTYDWGRGRAAIATGTALLYNHSDDANVDFYPNPKSATITFVANRRVRKDEELFICYDDEPMLLPEKRAKRARGQ